VAALGLPEAGPIRAFELTGPDAAMGAAWKQTVISDDGKRLLYRVYRGGWGPWNTLPVVNLGIAGVSEARSFSQGLNPAGQPKQDVLAADGLTVRSRVFASGRWGPGSRRSPCRRWACPRRTTRWPRASGCWPRAGRRSGRARTC
jgi:hypothetical protein